MALMHGDRPNKHGRGSRVLDGNRATASLAANAQFGREPGGVNGRVRSSLDASCTMNRLDTAVDGRLSGINNSRFKRLKQ
jgi:hypothetical protein